MTAKKKAPAVKPRYYASVDDNLVTPAGSPAIIPIIAEDKHAIELATSTPSMIEVPKKQYDALRADLEETNGQFEFRDIVEKFIPDTFWKSTLGRVLLAVASLIVGFAGGATVF